MKKILCVASVLATLIGTANAVELKPYIGLEGSYSKTKFDNYFINNYQPIAENRENNANIGLNAGVKVNLSDKFYVGGEGYLSTGNLIDQDETYTYAINKDDIEKIKLNQYAGLRINGGYEFNQYLSAFGFIGLNVNYYESEYTDTDSSDYYHSTFDEIILSPSIGFGLSYNITKNFEAKLSYEFTKFTVEDKALGKYQAHWNEAVDKDVDIKVNTVRVGLNYLF